MARSSVTPASKCWWLYWTTAIWTYRDADANRTFINIGRQTTNEHFPGVDLDALRRAGQRRKSGGAAERRRQGELLLQWRTVETTHDAAARSAGAVVQETVRQLPSWRSAQTQTQRHFPRDITSGGSNERLPHAVYIIQ